MHYNQMIHLSPASNKVSSQQFLLDKIKKHLRILVEVLVQNIKQDVFVHIIRSKIPDVAFRNSKKIRANLDSSVTK